MVAFGNSADHDAEDEMLFLNDLWTTEDSATLAPDKGLDRADSELVTTCQQVIPNPAPKN
jgi:hypothetical protein